MRQQNLDNLGETADLNQFLFGSERAALLAAWTERNTEFGGQIGDAMKERGIIAELTVSNRVAQWAYEQTDNANGLTWVRADRLVPLDPAWRTLFSRG